MGIASLIQDMGDQVYAIDTGYVRPGMAASHLVVDAGRAAFIDTGTSNSTERLLGALEHVGLTPKAVEYILLTHIHLDHAGGAGRLLQSLPNATMVVHPRGAPHMIDPARLIKGTKAVYGEAEFRRLYGEIPPVRADRVRAVEDGERLVLGERQLDFIHTRGHANHHYCIVDAKANSIFSGDTFGVSYRDTDTRLGAFIFPTTTPVDFDPEAAHASIDRLMSLQPQAIYLTHYSKVTELERLAADLHRHLDEFVNIARYCVDMPDRMQNIADRLRDYLWRELNKHEFEGNDRLREDILGADIELNAMGLDVWLTRSRNTRGAA